MNLPLVLLNSVAFILYGFLVLFTDHMIDEFRRYGLLRFRRLVGVLEVLGGAGCILGHLYSQNLFLFSCSGLAVLMSSGVIVRVKVRDPFLFITPAIILGVLNYWMVYIKVSS